MMRHGRGLALLGWCGIAAIFGSGLACKPKGGQYVGRWECASGRSSFLEIKANKDAFLVTDESGKTFPASIDDSGSLVLKGVPLMESLPLPIDSDSGELVCSACTCNRYEKSSATVEARRDDQAAQKRTVADIRNVGTAMFSWLTDQVGAGAAGQSQVQQIVDLTHYTRITRKRLEEILVPRYLQEVPEKDGWGHPYEYYLGVENVLAPQVMSIRSAGRDGKFTSTAYNVSPFPSTDFDEDIVWSDGFFVRWPGTQAQ